jgi:prepilin-type N-terminal cleavage/methylation domain-containing protein
MIHFQEGKMQRFSACRQGGFTLVEVMVSLVIFLIASMGLLPLLINNLQVNLGNNLHSQARRLAGEQMTRLQVIAYDQLADVSPLPRVAGTFEVRRKVESDQPRPDQSRITVTTRWQERGRRHSYQLQTIRSAP